MGTANDRRSDRKESDARVQVHDVGAGADAADNVGNKLAQQKSVALKKRLHVPPQTHLVLLHRQRVGDLRIADQNRRACSPSYVSCVVS